MLYEVTFVRAVYAAEPSDTNEASGGNNGDESSGANTFSTNKDDIVQCEHRSRNRIIVADSSEFAESPLKCDFCDNNALDGTPLRQATVCEACGAAICENCNAYNSDSDKDSGIGEE